MRTSFSWSRAAPPPALPPLPAPSSAALRSPPPLRSLLRVTIGDGLLDRRIGWAGSHATSSVVGNETGRLTPAAKPPLLSGGMACRGRRWRTDHVAGVLVWAPAAESTAAASGVPPTGPLRAPRSRGSVSVLGQRSTDRRARSALMCGSTLGREVAFDLLTAQGHLIPTGSNRRHLVKAAPMSSVWGCMIRPCLRRREGGRHRNRGGLIGLTVAALVVMLVLATFVVGVPGPGVLRRYPLRDLESARNELINRPDECGGGTPSEDHRRWREDTTSIDLIRSRVVVAPDVSLGYWHEAPPSAETMALVDGDRFWAVRECLQ